MQVKRHHSRNQASTRAALPPASHTHLRRALRLPGVHGPLFGGDLCCQALVLCPEVVDLGPQPPQLALPLHRQHAKLLQGLHLRLSQTTQATLSQVPELLSSVNPDGHQSHGNVDTLSFAADSSMAFSLSVILLICSSFSRSEA